MIKKRNNSYLSEKEYKKYIKMKQKNKLSKKKTKQLKKKLQQKYCKCIQKIKNNNNSQFPICTSSIYKRRGFKPPESLNKNCYKKKQKSIKKKSIKKTRKSYKNR